MEYGIDLLLKNHGDAKNKWTKSQRSDDGHKNVPVRLYYSFILNNQRRRSDKPNYPQKMNCACGAVYRNILIRVRTE